MSIRSWIKVGLTSSNVFDTVQRHLETELNKSCGSMIELKGRTTKAKGDLWEEFCKLYLQAKYPDSEIYLQKDIPAKLRTELKLPATDLGIDIIVVAEDFTIAVQCKYRKMTKEKAYVRYKDLSTFLTLCNRTGPWTRHLVMTNCTGASWKGLKTKKDKVYAVGTFRKTDLSIWMKMSGSEGYSLTDGAKVKRPVNVAAKRAAYYEKLLKK